MQAITNLFGLNHIHTGDYHKMRENKRKEPAEIEWTAEHLTGPSRERWWMCQPVGILRVHQMGEYERLYVEWQREVGFKQRQDVINDKSARPPPIKNAQYLPLDTVECIKEDMEKHAPGWRDGVQLFDWPGQEGLSAFMEEFGFIVVRYAAGSELEQLRLQLQEYWREGSKVAITNTMEHSTFQEPKNKPNHNPHAQWRESVEDCARLQVHVPDDTFFGVEKFVESIYPEPLKDRKSRYHRRRNGGQKQHLRRYWLITQVCWHSMSTGTNLHRALSEATPRWLSGLRGLQCWPCTHTDLPIPAL